MRKPNDVGVGWKETADDGREYISFALDVDILLELAGGAIEKAKVLCYPIQSENPKAPDYQLKFYPKGAPRQAAARPAPAPIGPRAVPAKPVDDDFPPF